MYVQTHSFSVSFSKIYILVPPRLRVSHARPLKKSVRETLTPIQETARGTPGDVKAAMRVLIQYVLYDWLIRMTTGWAIFYRVIQCCKLSQKRERCTVAHATAPPPGETEQRAKGIKADSHL